MPRCRAYDITAPPEDARFRKSSLDSEGGIALAEVGGVWTLQVTLDPEDTAEKAASPAQGCYHEAEVTEASGAVHTVATGPFRLLPSVT